jgi:hypothetical protein
MRGRASCLTHKDSATWVMARDRSTSGTADLFKPPSGVVSRSPRTAKPVGRKQIVLPSNLPLALQSLDDSSFNALVREVGVEARRRGVAAPGAAIAEIADHKVASKKATESPETRSKIAANKVPTGKANLIRAAFKAGVKPAAIAREFGISPSVVRDVLAGLKNRR